MNQRDKRRKFGQNYLKDPAILFEIEQSISPQPNDKFFEIGPGMGALTRILNKENISITAMDIDEFNVSYLKKEFSGPATFNFIQDNILDNDLNFLAKELHRIAGNLPYNISTQIILKMIKYNKRIKDMHFLVQKEVAEKIAGAPGTKDWGKIGIKLAAFFTTEILFDVPPEAFDIKPKVNSSFIRMTPLKDKLLEDEQIKDFFEIIDLSFTSRRKNIKNNLKNKNVDWSKIGIDEKSRPEELNLESFLKIVKEVNKS